MTALLIDRRLQSCSDAELAEYWQELARVLELARDYSTGPLGERYAAAYERCRAEFALRGVQLALF
jgi:hypothetical protein